MAMGSKYNIKPVTRAFLSSIDALIAVDSPEIEEGLRRGIRGESGRSYGLPFLGDNAFLIDRIEEAGETVTAYWYCRLNGSEEIEKKRISRFTTKIDRGDVSRSKTALFAPLKEPSREIPLSAWMEVVY
jgi:CRISPR-associated protein Cas5t